MKACLGDLKPIYYIFGSFYAIMIVSIILCCSLSLCSLFGVKKLKQTIKKTEIKDNLVPFIKKDNEKLEITTDNS